MSGFKQLCFEIAFIFCIKLFHFFGRKMDIRLLQLNGIM